MPKKQPFEIASLHRGTLTLGDPDVGAHYFESEYDAEFNIEKAKLKHIKAIELPLLLRSPRWPESFKKHYVHNNDYAALEARYFESRGREQSVSSRLADVEQQIKEWRTDNHELRASMTEEHEVVGAMYDQFRHLTGCFEELMGAVQRHHAVVEGFDARAHGLVPDSQPHHAYTVTEPDDEEDPQGAGLQRGGGSGGGASEGSPARSSPAFQRSWSRGLNLQRPGEARFSAGGAESPGRRAGIQDQLAAMQAEIASLAEAVKGMATVRRSSQRTYYTRPGAQGDAPARPASAPLKRRHPVIKLKPPAEAIQPYPVDEKTGRVIGDNRGYWRP
mmetsp:Transcript_28715/g.72993  ORF Transcript_28715/g.72993 Transcript_28715/m.72993 type:complete len:332 (-) Transcript_28715:179-1174(-)|eukprot:CAMPEP_0202881496 /NCGR_PEP_ID=MMETSP1391-20130828/36621_1 /ASSEMBLY_ACC=CAM_ASM_000867 /TAXON_ID=1034604 /ORGANISM="Chlamydomonas leiostraca, Strain SAG 11-49" /LENGTH=331 /DNA_ID=CAMNT_0049564195 /DNA_START=30 /DNA_END=1025 /DNA_ORIENTATION=+